MSVIYSFLEEVKAKLQTISGVEGVKIGMEKGIGSKDCPFIRIVPEENIQSSIDPKCEAGRYAENIHDNVTIQIIYGFDLKNQELEKLYEEFYNLEKEIRTALISRYDKGYIKFIHTVTDEDRLTNIKSAISRFEMVGLR